MVALPGCGGSMQRSRIPLWNALKAAMAGNALGIGFALHEMDERIVVQPQRHIADAVRLGGLQFRKHPGNQFGVFVSHFRRGLIPDQGPFHRLLHGSHHVSIPRTFGRTQRMQADEN